MIVPTENLPQVLLTDIAIVMARQEAIKEFYLLFAEQSRIDQGYVVINAIGDSYQFVTHKYRKGVRPQGRLRQG